MVCVQCYRPSNTNSIYAPLTHPTCIWFSHRRPMRPSQRCTRLKSLPRPCIANQAHTWTRQAYPIGSGSGCASKKGWPSWHPQYCTVTGQYCRVTGQYCWGGFYTRFVRLAFPSPTAVQGVTPVPTNQPSVYVTEQ